MNGRVSFLLGFQERSLKKDILSLASNFFTGLKKVCLQLGVLQYYPLSQYCLLLRGITIKMSFITQSYGSGTVKIFSIVYQGKLRLQDAHSFCNTNSLTIPGFPGPFQEKSRSK